MKHEVGTLTFVYLVLAGTMLAFSSQAQADGFDCSSPAANLRIDVENYRNADEGTRNVESMTLENLNNPKSAVMFDTKQGSLRNRSAYYFAKVDLRYSQIRTSKLEIFKKNLADFESIYLNVEFSYAEPLPAGTKVKGVFSAIDRETRKLEKLTLSCERTVDTI